MPFSLHQEHIPTAHSPEPKHSLYLVLYLSTTLFSSVHLLRESSLFSRFGRRSARALSLFLPPPFLPELRAEDKGVGVEKEKEKDSPALATDAGGLVACVE